MTLNQEKILKCLFIKTAVKQRRFLERLAIACVHLVLFSVAIYIRPSGPSLLDYTGAVDAVSYTHLVDKLSFHFCVSLIIVVNLYMACHFMIQLNMHNPH